MSKSGAHDWRSGRGICTLDGDRICPCLYGYIIAVRWNCTNVLSVGNLRVIVSGIVVVIGGGVVVANSCHLVRLLLGLFEIVSL